MSDWQDESVFGWDYPPGVTTRMIDEQAGEEDDGVEIDISERPGEALVVLKYGSEILLQWWEIADGPELKEEFVLNKGQAHALVKAIQDRL